MEDKNEINEFNNNKNETTPQYDSNIFEFKGELISIDTEIINLILNDINKNFILEDFSLFEEENEVLEFFYYKEKESLESIEVNFKDNETQKLFLKNFISDIIEDKYQYNKSLENFRNKIDIKINEFIEDIKNYKDIDNYNLSKSYIKKFQTDKMPKFLEKNIIEVFEIIKLVNEFNPKSEDIYLEKKKEYSKKDINYDSFIFYYFQFLNKENIPFDVGDKNVLFDILLYSNLKDIHKNPRIKKIFINNYLDISECLNYHGGIPEFEKAINNKNELEIIDYKLKNIFDKYKIDDNHLYIIASFFYLVINKMKDTKTYKSDDEKTNIRKNNLNQPFLVKILKNILINFVRYCPCKEYNLETYINLFNYFNKYIIQNETSGKINKYYGSEDVEMKIKNADNYKYISEYDDLIKEIKTAEFFSSLLKILKNFFKLIPLTKNRNSHTITILISGFLSQLDDFDSWKLFYVFDKENSNYYLFKWPSSNVFTFAIRTLANVVYSGTSFLCCYKKAECAGKILALFLLSNEEFYDCQINLVGFSLGCHVLINCLKELNEFRTNKFMINNVLLMGGATVIEDSEKSLWRNIFRENVAGRIINCYSSFDDVLSYLFKICIMKTPIGIKKLNIKDENGEYPIVEDYDFSDIKLGHLEYRKKFETILKRIDFFNWN